MAEDLKVRDDIFFSGVGYGVALVQLAIAKGVDMSELLRKPSERASSYQARLSGLVSVVPEDVGGTK